MKFKKLHFENFKVPKWYAKQVLVSNVSIYTKLVG